MGLVSNLLFGVRVIVDALGVAYPTRNRVRFEGAATVADDPVYGETVVTVGGDGTSPTFDTVSAQSLVLGSNTPAQYTLSAQPSVPTTTGATVNLLAAAIPLVAGKSTSITVWAKGVLQSAATIVTYDAVFNASYSRPSTGNATLYNLIGGTAYFAPAPFTDGVNGPQTISAAASSGGQIELTIGDSTDIHVSATMAITGATGGLANGSYIIDSIPDGTHVVLRGTTYSSTGTGTLSPQGQFGASVTSNAAQITGTGIAPAPYIPGEVVAVGAVRTSPAGVYIVSSPGTTASGTGPTGTGTNIGSGSAAFDYHGPNCVIVWTACSVEVRVG